MIKSSLFLFTGKTISMAYSETIEEKIRENLSKREDVEEKRMMGGITFMVNDKMCVGVLKNDMMCRIDPELHETLVEKPGCRTLDITRRAAIGFVLVNETVLKTQADYDYWINLCLDFNARAKASRKRKKPTIKVSDCSD